jgi:endo-1,4-beta-xylanase
MEELSRRRTMVLGLGMAVTACGGGGGSGGSGSVPVVPGPTPTPTPTPTPPATTQSIGAAAAARNLRFGSTFAWSTPGADRGSFANQSYAALLEAEARLLVPENEMKWQALRPNAVDFNFGQADEMVAYAQSKGLRIRGHTLLWYVAERFPTWLTNYDFGANPRAEAERLVREHVQTVARRYRDTINDWDVVNEAIEPATGALRQNALSRAVGGDPSLLDLAFRTARAELPNAELVYNDYMDGGTPAHRRGVLELLRGFKARGVPVDTLGVQSHIGFYGPATEPVANWVNFNITQNMKPFLDEVVAMGYKLKITEMDINDRNRGGTVAERDEASAGIARAWLDLFLSYPQTRDVLVWGMVDKYSWLQTFIDPRQDGQPLRPTPFDASFQRKPLADAYLAAFQAAAVRPA